MTHFVYAHMSLRLFHSGLQNYRTPAHHCLPGINRFSYSRHAPNIAKEQLP